MIWMILVMTSETLLLRRPRLSMKWLVLMRYRMMQDFRCLPQDAPLPLAGYLTARTLQITWQLEVPAQLCNCYIVRLQPATLPHSKARCLAAILDPLLVYQVRLQ